MKDREIAAVAERAEQRALLFARLADKGERLVGMAGEHNVVEPVAAPAAVNDGRPQMIALDPDGARSVTDGARERKAHAAHIFHGAAADGAPDRAPAELQEAVIVVETDESRRGKGHDLGGRRRPDRARHRKDMMVTERLAVAARRQILTEAQMVLVDAAGVAGRAAIESRKIRQHPPKSRAHDVRRLAEQTDETIARIFDPRVIERDGEGHVGRLRLDAESLQEFDEIGICSRIVDDEAAIDGDFAAIDTRKDRIRMSADPVGLLVNDDVVTPVEQPCGGKAGDACSHDANAKTRS